LTPLDLVPFAKGTSSSEELMVLAVKLRTPRAARGFFNIRRVSVSWRTK